MKLYATVTSERATKGQGGNDYLEVNVNISSESPTYRLRVINDKLEDGRELGKIYISLESLSFGKWVKVYGSTVLENIEKAKKQKDESRCAHGMPYGGKLCVICNE